MKMEQALVNFLAGKLRKIYNIDKIAQGPLRRAVMDEIVKKEHFTDDTFNYRDFFFNGKKYSLTLKEVRDFMYNLIASNQQSNINKKKFAEEKYRMSHSPITSHKEHRTPIRASDDFLSKNIGEKFPKRDKRHTWVGPKPVAEKITGYHERTNTYIREYSKRYMAKYGIHEVVEHFFVYSVYVLHNKNTAVLKVNGQTYKKIKAPKGYIFGKDEHGFNIYRKNKSNINYHPTADELLMGPKYLARQVRELEEVRKKARLRSKAYKLNLDSAKLKKIYVYKQDALKAGNCNTGIESFREQHRLHQVKTIRADKLAKVALGYKETNRDLYYRIKKTIQQAYLRKLEA